MKLKNSFNYFLWFWSVFVFVFFYIDFATDGGISHRFVFDFQRNIDFFDQFNISWALKQYFYIKKKQRKRKKKFPKLFSLKSFPQVKVSNSAPQRLCWNYSNICLRFVLVTRNRANCLAISWLIYFHSSRTLKPLLLI